MLYYVCYYVGYSQSLKDKWGAALINRLWILLRHRTYNFNYCC